MKILSSRSFFFCRIKIKKLKSNSKEKTFHQHLKNENTLFVSQMTIVKIVNISRVHLVMKWLNG